MHSIKFLPLHGKLWIQILLSTEMLITDASKAVVNESSSELNGTGMNSKPVTNILWAFGTFKITCLKSKTSKLYISVLFVVASMRKN